MQYRDYIAYMDSEDVCIHISDEMIFEKEIIKPVLLISHNLSVTGAPLALLDAARVLMKNNYQVFIVSFWGEDILEGFLKCGCIVLLYSGKTINAAHLKKMADIFPVVLVNTLGLVPLAEFFTMAGKEVFWWIHEGNYFFENLHYECDKIPWTSSLHLLAASPKASRAISAHLGRESLILNVMVEDQFDQERLWKKDKIHFLWAGVINSNKRPELLLRAIAELPKSYEEYVDFTFCGDGVDNERKEWIQKRADTSCNITYVSAMPHQQFIEFLKEMDVIVVCSEEETTSLVALEGLMLEKTVICSDGCGITEYLSDGKDSYTFSSGNHKELGEKIRYVADHFEELTFLRRAGRNVYERYYTEAVFEKRLLEIFG